MSRTAEDIAGELLRMSRTEGAARAVARMSRIKDIAGELPA